MIKLGLIGYPITHSLSPVMQKAALTYYGLKGDYVLLGTPPEKLRNMVDFIKKSGFRGFNITIPHKVAIIDCLDSVDKLALKVGAVNTVVIEENKRLTGYNTDVHGFIYGIPTDIRISLTGKNAAIIGSGGAARAVTTGMAEMGIEKIDIITLESELQNAGEIMKALNKNYPKVKVDVKKLDENVDFKGVSLIVNATPVGMEGKFEGMSPISEYSINSMDKGAFVYDIIYKPEKTKLIELAQKRGLIAINGLDMLVLQGAKAFNLWTGEEAPVDAMRSAVSQLVIE